MSGRISGRILGRLLRGKSERILEGHLTDFVEEFLVGGSGGKGGA